MSRHIFRSVQFRGALLLTITLLTGLFQSAPPVTGFAQGASKTFSETGKTVSGKFLDYWNRNGGLAQQGYPISEEIQETSDTDGKIYTVQYFERSVFEHHPENAGKPSEVLLSLLGTFLHIQKYKQGVPSATPNNEPGSRRFAETGKRLGGKFLAYWEKNGALAQQGFPISDEFMEKNDLDGKTYKVQYFERAVFELHPENQPPFDVLLSQLGTFRYRAKYSATLGQLSGNGNKVVASVPLKAGLAVFQSVRADNDGYLYINAISANNVRLGTIGVISGPGDVSVALPVEADGMYGVDVEASGGWTVNISQPKATYAPPPAKQQWSGHSWQASPLFSLKAGRARFHVVSPNDQAASKETPARVDLLDQNGIRVGESFAGGSDPLDVTADIDIPSDGVYILRIFIIDADWTITVEQ